MFARQSGISVFLFRLALRVSNRKPRFHAERIEITLRIIEAFHRGYADSIFNDSYFRTDFCIMILMKTTLDIQDNLLASAKAAAAIQRTTLTRLIEEGLSMRLAAMEKKPLARRATLPVMNGKGGMRKGIDPTSNRALLDAMEE
jgi:hypothetical protein